MLPYQSIFFVVQQCLSLQNQHSFGGPLSSDTRAAYISISRSALNNFCARKKPSATRGSTWPWWEAMWQLSSGDTYRWWFQLLFIYRPSCGTNISPTSRHFLSRWCSFCSGMICDLFPGGYRHLFGMDRFNTSFQSLQIRGRFLFANCSFPWNSVPAQSHKSPDIHDILQFWGSFRGPPSVVQVGCQMRLPQGSILLFLFLTLLNYKPPYWFGEKKRTNLSCVLVKMQDYWRDLIKGHQYPKCPSCWGRFMAVQRAPPDTSFQKQYFNKGWWIDESSFILSKILLSYTRFSRVIKQVQQSQDQHSHKPSKQAQLHHVSGWWRFSF